MKRVEILIEGRLDAKWAEWFEGFDIAYTEAGETILSGSVSDQAALYGLVAKLRDLGVKLISASLEESIPSRSRSKDGDRK